MPRRRLEVHIAWTDDAPRPPWWYALVIVAAVAVVLATLVARAV